MGFKIKSSGDNEETKQFLTIWGKMWKISRVFITSQRDVIYGQQVLKELFFDEQEWISIRGSNSKMNQFLIGVLLYSRKTFPESIKKQ